MKKSNGSYDITKWSERIQKAVHSLREGKDQTGIEQLIQVIKAGKSLSLSKEKKELLMPHLELLLSAMKENDLIELTDLLEFSIGPLSIELAKKEDES